MTSHPIYDVFQKGLIRGSAHLPFDPKKAYAFVEHPTEGWRVYLRTCAFLPTFVLKVLGKEADKSKFEERKSNLKCSIANSV